MIYTFECEECEKQFDVNLPMAECKKPLSEPCPLCDVEGKVFRVFEAATHGYDMVNTKEKKAGLSGSNSEWGSVMKRIHKQAGSGSQMGRYI